MTSSGPVSGGTTDASTMPGDLLARDAMVFAQVATRMPSSSAVRSRIVVSRQLCISSLSAEDAEDDVGVADVDG